MSVALRRERWLCYGPNGTGGYALTPSTGGDQAWWGSYAPKASRETAVGAQQVTVERVTLTVRDDVPVADAGLVRRMADGALYRVAGTTDLPSARLLVVECETVGRDAVSITADVPEYTVGAVIVSPGAVTAPAGTRDLAFTAAVSSLTGAPLAGRAPQWASSDYAVFLMAATGLGEALAAGGATVTATVDGVSGTASVTVTP